MKMHRLKKNVFSFVCIKWFTPAEKHGKKWRKSNSI